MSVFTLLLMAGTSLAGHWLPEAKVELAPAAPWPLEQPAGSRRLLQLAPPDVSIEAWADGARIPLADGPGGTLLLPARDTARVVEIRAAEPVEIAWWRESSEGESAAWDRYAADLHGWAVQGGQLPAAPAAIPSLELEWAARPTAGA